MPPPVVLGVDQASESGWSLHVGRRPIASGHFSVWNYAARAEVVREAYALSSGTPFLFAYEDHARAPLRSYKYTGQVLGLGGALWLWLDALNRVGHPEDMRLGITSRDWRAIVLGLNERRIGREGCKREAVRWAEAYANKRPLTDDEAESIAIGAYAVFHEHRERVRRAQTNARRTGRARRVSMHKRGSDGHRTQ